MGEIGRRQFIKKSTATVVVTSACLCGLGGLGGCATITKVGDTPAINPGAFSFADGVLNIDLAKETKLAGIGGSVKIKHADITDGIIIAHVAESQYAIASLLCTHRGVEVEYDHDQNNFTCASLGSSTFKMDGGNIDGPAENPLKSYEAAFSGDLLTIKL